MTGLNTDYGNKSGNRFISGATINTGMRKITGIEFKTGDGYVPGKGNKAG